MSDAILDPSQIDALLAQAAAGELPSASAVVEEERKDRSRRLRVLDFSRPQKFGPEQENRMRRLHEAFCRVAGQRMAGQHRIPMELEVIDTSQRTWRDAFRQIPSDAVFCTMELRPYGTQCLIAGEMPMLLLCIDMLLGADDDQPTVRKLTSIDVALVKRVLGELAAALTITWQDLANVEFALGSVENDEEAEQVMAPSEPTLSIAMEARLGNVSSTIVLLLPHAAVAPALAEFAARSQADLQADPFVNAMLHKRVGEAPVNVRAELGSAVMGLHQVLGLKPGDSIRLSGPAPGEATLMVDDIAVFGVRAGRQGSARAVQVEAAVRDQDEEAQA